MTTKKAPKWFNDFSVAMEFYFASDRPVQKPTLSSKEKKAMRKIAAAFTKEHHGIIILNMDKLK